MHFKFYDIIDMFYDQNSYPANVILKLCFSRMIFNASLCSQETLYLWRSTLFPFLLVWSTIIQLLLCDFPFIAIMLNLCFLVSLFFVLYYFFPEEIIPRSIHAAVGTDSSQGYHLFQFWPSTREKIFSMSHYGQNVSQVITLSLF